MQRRIEIAGSNQLIHGRMGTEIAAARLAGSRGVDTALPALPVMPAMPTVPVMPAMPAMTTTVPVMPAMRAVGVMELMMERAKPERLEGTKIETIGRPPKPGITVSVAIIIAVGIIVRIVIGRVAWIVIRILRISLRIRVSRLRGISWRSSISRGGRGDAGPDLVTDLRAAFQESGQNIVTHTASFQRDDFIRTGAVDHGRILDVCLDDHGIHLCIHHFQNLTNARRKLASGSDVGGAGARHSGISRQVDRCCQRWKQCKLRNKGGPDNSSAARPFLQIFARLFHNET